jgi:hypothetical protein
LYLGASEDRFCQALVYLLDCVRQLCDFAERQHGHLLQSMLPPERYRDLQGNRARLEITGELIGKQSIRYKPDDLPQWCKACKNMLTKLQHLCVLSVLRDQNELMQQPY